MSDPAPTDWSGLCRGKRTCASLAFCGFLLALHTPTGGQEVPPKSASHAPREWISARGTPMQASLLRFKDRDHVVLTGEQNRELTVALDQLSPADREYAAGIWAAENPIILFIQGPPAREDLFAFVANNMGRQLVFPRREVRDVYSTSPQTREFTRQSMAVWAAKTPSAEPPVLVDYAWNFHLHDRRQREDFVRNLKELRKTKGLETIRVVLVDEVIPPEGAHRFDAKMPGNRAMVPHDEMTALIEEFRREHVLPNEFLEIAPVREIYHHVFATTPEWNFRTGINNPTPPDLRKIVVMATILRQKPPLGTIRQTPPDKTNPAFAPLLAVREEKLEKLENHIFQTIQKANGR